MAEWQEDQKRERQGQKDQKREWWGQKSQEKERQEQKNQEEKRWKQDDKYPDCREYLGCYWRLSLLVGKFLGEFLLWFLIFDIVSPFSITYSFSKNLFFYLCCPCQ